MASTCAVVTPSARQCGPPELLATLPPIEQLCWLLGSGAKCRPSGDTARVRSRLSTPGSTHASRLHRIDRQHPVHLGGDDHDRVVERRRPTGQAGARAAGHERYAVSTATRTQACTSSAVVGKQTTRHGPRGWRHRAGRGPARSAPTRTRSGDSAAARSSTRESIMPGIGGDLDRDRGSA